MKDLAVKKSKEILTDMNEEELMYARGVMGCVNDFIIDVSKLGSYKQLTEKQVNGLSYEEVTKCIKLGIVIHPLYVEHLLDEEMIDILIEQVGEYIWDELITHAETALPLWVLTADHYAKAKILNL